MTAKTNGLEDLAQEVLEAAGLTEEDVAHMEIPSKPSKIAPPPVVTPAYQYNWPIVGATESFFDRALTAAANGDSAGVDYQSNGIEAQGANGLDEWAGEAGADDVAAEEAEDAWDLAADEVEQPVGDEEDAEVGEAEPDAPLSAGISESALWVRNSPLAADHVAAGSFETAMQVCIDHVRMFCSDIIDLCFIDSQSTSRRGQLRTPQTTLPLSIPLFTTLSTR